MRAQTAKIERDIVLLGAGNAHLQVVKWWGMRPIDGARLTLVNRASTMPYSGMLPGCISRTYRGEEITVDLARLCAVSGVTFIEAEAERVDVEHKEVHLRGRVPLRYDVLGMNIGSRPAAPESPIPPDKLLLLKPLETLMERIEALDTRVDGTEEKFHIVFAGGGASALEVCLALRTRYAEKKNLTYSMVVGGERILPRSSLPVSAHAAAALDKANVGIRSKVMVSTADENMLHLSDGDMLRYDLCVWATAAAPLPLVAASGFAVDRRGFVRAHDTLQTLTHADVFAVGDCVSLASHPTLPKAGVFAVREGPVLWDNLQAHLSGEDLRPYRPQKFYLFLLNTSDGKSIMSYGPWAASGKWVFGWKDFIDRNWTRKFLGTYADPMPMDEERCGGCGAKVGGEILQRVLDRLDVESHPKVIAGVAAGEDAAVQQLPDGRVEIQSVDFFRAFIGDAYLFGRIAAINALSDLYAMNAEPFSALATVTLPYAAPGVREGQLYQVLSGALTSFREHGVTLTGGHTSESGDFQIGFTVTGYAEPTRLFRKNALRAGDVLLLTKPLGTGALLRAAMMGQCSAANYAALLAGMQVSNRAAAEVFAQRGVRACTDVTGFGLAGHLLEMLDASRMSAELRENTVVRYPGFDEVAGENGTDEPIRSTLHDDNAWVRDRVVPRTGELPPWLFDPQTAGGLLAGVSADDAGCLLDALQEAGYADAVCIGTVRDAGDEPTIHLT
jgi:selenide,water dikinase